MLCVTANSPGTSCSSPVPRGPQSPLPACGPLGAWRRSRYRDQRVRGQSRDKVPGAWGSSGRWSGGQVPLRARAHPCPQACTDIGPRGQSAVGKGLLVRWFWRWRVSAEVQCWRCHTALREGPVLRPPAVSQVTASAIAVALRSGWALSSLMSGLGREVALRRRSCPLLAGRVLLRAQHRCPSETRSLLHRKRKRPVNVLYPLLPAGAFVLAVCLNQSLPWYLPRPSCCWCPSMALSSDMKAPSHGASHTL